MVSFYSIFLLISSIFFSSLSNNKEKHNLNTELNYGSYDILALFEYDKNGNIIYKDIIDRTGDIVRGSLTITSSYIHLNYNEDKKIDIKIRDYIFDEKIFRNGKIKYGFKNGNNEGLIISQKLTQGLWMTDIGLIENIYNNSKWIYKVKISSKIVL